MGCCWMRDSDGAILVVLVCLGFLCFSKLWSPLLSAAPPRHPPLHFHWALLAHSPPASSFALRDYLHLTAEGKLGHLAIECVV